MALFVLWHFWCYDSYLKNNCQVKSTIEWHFLFFLLHRFACFYVLNHMCGRLIHKYMYHSAIYVTACFLVSRTVIHTLVVYFIMLLSFDFCCLFYTLINCTNEVLICKQGTFNFSLYSRCLQFYTTWKILSSLVFQMSLKNDTSVARLWHKLLLFLVDINVFIPRQVAKMCCFRTKSPLNN